jgi:hypothetical protein
MSADTSRLEASIEAMREYFPEFSLSGSPIGTGPVAVWKGWVQPLQSSEVLEKVLDDIHHERPVMMRAGGIVEHRSDCFTRHCHHDWMERVTNPFIKYKLEVQYGGGEAHPMAFVRAPVPLPSKERKHHFDNGSLCAYPAWQDVWRWDRDTVVGFMSHAVEWLVKWTVWEQADIWLGTEKGHTPGLLLREIHPDQQCHCRSGRKYGLCHRVADESSVMRSIEEIIQRRLRS